MDLVLVVGNECDAACPPGNAVCEKSENTGDNAHTGIWLMILGFGTAGILAGRQRKKNVE